MTRTRSGRPALPTRRQTLMGLAAAGGLSALPGLPSAEPVLRAPLPRAQPRKGGRLVLAVHEARVDETLLPTRLETRSDFVRALQIGSTLTRLGPEMEPRPDLALDWETDGEGLVWTFRLRGDVSFHDGRRMRPEDVVFSLDLHRRAGSQSRLGPRLAHVEEIRAAGTDTLTIRLGRPDGFLPVLLADPRAIVVPEGFTDWGRLVGTGPFRLVRFVPGVEMVAERNPDHHLGGAHVDEAVTLSLPERGARLTALAAGTVHYATGLDAEALPVLEGSAAVPAVSPGASHPVFVMRSEAESPLSDPDLRLALKAVVERRAMVEDVFGGLARPGADMPFAPGLGRACLDIEAPEADPDRARFHLERTGLIRPVLKLQTSPAAGGLSAPRLARHLAASAARVGLRIEVEEVAPARYWSRVWRRTPFHMSHWEPYPTAHEHLSRAHRSDSRWNESGWGDSGLDGAIARYGALPAGEEREAMGCSIQRRIAEEGGSLIPVFPDWIDGRAGRLRGWISHPSGPACGHRVAETVWFADAEEAVGGEAAQ